MTSRLLAASTDSVGSKLVLARRAGACTTAGKDLAAHCIDDVLTTGAEPLFLLDYVAAHELDLTQVAELVAGAAEVCRAAGCALLGGETAELPGVYREEELDFAGTCVGIVDARPPDRRLAVRGRRRRARPPLLRSARQRLLARPPSLVGDEDFDADLLLAPHRLYLDEVRELRSRADVKALAHVTGGGIAGNLTRVLPEGVGVEIDWGSWARPPVFDWLTKHGVEEEEQRRVFNLGIGICAVVPAGDAEAGTVIGTARLIGVLVSGEGTNLQALIDAGLPIVCVASNRPEARALERAEQAGLPARAFRLEDYAGRDERDEAMAAWLEEHGVDLVVCAGYMHLLRPCFLERFPGRVVNTHSAPLPDFPGAHGRSRTCSRPACPRQRPPSTTSTRAWTAGP